MRRLFVAIKIGQDPGFLQVFRSIKSCLKHERIKWVEENNLHITLKFFGETEEGVIPKIQTILGNKAMTFQSFDYSLSGLGVFGSRYSPRVIWSGLEPYKNFSIIMKDLQQDFELIGFRGDRQNHVPHLTLGRIKSIVDLVIFQQTIDQFREFLLPPHRAAFYILYESILAAAGPEYHIIRKFSFKPGNSLEINPEIRGGAND